MKALVVGNSEDTTWALPHLLTRAGFSVDVINKAHLLSQSKYINSFFFVPPQDSVSTHLFAHIEINGCRYDWIILTEDRILQEVLQSDTPDEFKLKVLPVLSREDFRHIFSKTGLSLALTKHGGVRTPDFRIAYTLDAARICADELGYPLILKVDASGAGGGTHECLNVHDLETHAALFDGHPLLLQQKIVGQELDLSALFLDGRLIHFNYALIRKTIGPFGVSKVRDYLPLRYVQNEIFHELQQLGEALGANGFTNISCIDSNDQRYYFECDMRPNVWVDFPYQFSDDPAMRIRDWFTDKKSLVANNTPSSNDDKKFVQMSYFLRLDKFELIFNRYNVWDNIPLNDKHVVMNLIMNKLLPENIFIWVRRYIPYNLRSLLKKTAIKIGIY
jgi:hypothetical protein